MTWLIVAIARVLVAVLAVFGVWAYRTANRLDRLHVRYDLSWQALDGALARRAVVARAVAIDAYGGASEGRRLAALADAAERAPRPARETCRERAVGRAGDGRSGVAAGRPDRRAGRRRGPGGAGPPLPQRRGPRHAGAARTAPGAAVPPRRNRRAAKLFRDRRAAARAGARRSTACVNRRTSARVVLLDETGAVLLLCGSDPGARRAATRRSGGSRWAARCSRGSGWPRPPRGSWPRRPVCGSTPADMVGPVWRRDAGLRVQRRGDRQRGVLLRPPHPPVRAVDARAAPNWNAATSTATAGVTLPTSPHWSRRVRRCTRCSSPNCSPTRPRSPSTPARAGPLQSIR